MFYDLSQSSPINKKKKNDKERHCDSRDGEKGGKDGREGMNQS